MQKFTRYMLIAAFVEGASVMAVELLGAKIIAPWFGFSLYVWASVLGVTMIGLAGGYFLGGWLSERGDPGRQLFTLLAMAGLFTGIMPFTSHWIMEATLLWDVRWGSLISSMVFLLPPVLLMGTISPLMIRFCTVDKEKTGKVAGLVYAVSTLGGVFSTFLSGFYLIPEWGLYKPAYLFAFLLLLSAILYFILRRNLLRGGAAVLIGLLLTLAAFLPGQGAPSAPEGELRMRSDGIMGRVEVVDASFGDTFIRTLYLNGLPQTVIRRDNGCSILGYVDVIRNLASAFPRGSRTLLLGMGGGSLLRELNALGHEVTVCELDHRFPDVARDWFGVDTDNAEIHADDARHCLNTLEGNYDLIIFDVFFGDEPPGYVVTQESMERVNALLNPNGLALIYFPGAIEGEGSRPSRALQRTLSNAGFSVTVSNEAGLADAPHIYIASRGKFSYGRYAPGPQSGCATQNESPFVPLYTPKDIGEGELLTDEFPLSSLMWGKRKGAGGNRTRFQP